MKNKEEFFVPYIKGSLGKNTKRTLKVFTLMVILITIGGAAIFSITQKPFKNSTFELSSETSITGVYHESPYPMLRVEIAENTFKNILLLGFGKSGVNPFLKTIQKEEKNLHGKRLSIEGNLIYYNGKTLIQITSNEKIKLLDSPPVEIPEKQILDQVTVAGEIIDPKCYFGVMKPGKGKIHRSCAVLCIAGGIPPVLASTDNNGVAKYFLITDTDGNAINQEVLPFVGKPSRFSGIVEKFEDWHLLKISTDAIKPISAASAYYSD